MNDTVEPAPPSEEMRTKGQARHDLDSILSLRKNPDYQLYFARRIREKIQPIESALLTKRNMKPEEFMDLQCQRATLRGVLDMLDEDEQGNRSILGIPLPAD